jgi:hypothetical protein
MRRRRGGAADEGGGDVPVREFAARAAATALVGGVEGAHLGTGAVGRGGGQLVSLALRHDLLIVYVVGIKYVVDWLDLEQKYYRFRISGHFPTGWWIFELFFSVLTYSHIETS